jgi:hypothetical protein
VALGLTDNHLLHTGSVSLIFVFLPLRTEFGTSETLGFAIGSFPDQKVYIPSQENPLGLSFLTVRWI